ncbi:MAG: dTMP kinase [Alphaproteobacteria bacterium]|nr:MAG: dTMP kinase [Alphaproteobacteria bacterium]
MRRRGVFLSLEGGEGVGKTTQIALLRDRLQHCGVDVCITREPGGTALAEQIRPLLVCAQQESWCRESEMLLFMAARVQHVQRVILPALERGQWVLCDRFHDSSRVYQTYAHQMPMDSYDALHRMMLGGFIPDLTLVLDAPVDIGLARAYERHNHEMRFEALDRSFHQAVRDGFLACAQREPHRMKVVDATCVSELVHQQLWEHVIPWLP